MKSLLGTLVVLLLFFAAASAQERLSRPEALKFAFFLSLDLKQMIATPIATDPDPKRPLAIRHGDHGLVLLPETRLNAKALATIGKEIIPVGQLWLAKIAPMIDGLVVPSSKLRMVEVKADAGQGTAACCALGIRKNSAGKLELLVYGQSQEPLITVPLKSVSGDQDSETPLDISAERKDDSAVLTLKLLGKFEAAFPVGQAEP